MPNNMMILYENCFCDELVTGLPYMATWRISYSGIAYNATMPVLRFTILHLY